MDKKRKHTKLNLKKYLEYFKNNLSGKRKHAFEKNMMQDKFDEEAFEGLSQLDFNELSADISEIQNKITERTKKRKSVYLPVLRYAAIIVILLGIGGTLYYIFNSIEKTSSLAERALKKEDTISAKKAVVEPEEELEEIKAIKKETKKIIEEKQAKSDKAAPSIIYEYEEEPEEELNYEMEMADMEIVEDFSEDTEEIDEVAVVGYGPVKKSYLTGAVVLVEEEQIESGEAIEVEALQSKAAGVSIKSKRKYSLQFVKESEKEEGKMEDLDSSGTLIQIRGLNSVDYSGEPLIVVDGVPFNDDLNKINSDDIEKIEILKDASATAIYGSQATDGVILITTKSGSIKSENLADTYSLAVVENETSYKVQGTIFDNTTYEPLPGVNIILKGTSTGTISDLKGNFTLEIPKTEESVLEIAFVGYTPEEVAVKGEEDLSIALEEDILAMEEVVVIGYGAQRKQESSGSVSRIDMDEEYTPAPTIIPPKPVCGIKEYKNYLKENILYNELPEFDKNLTVKLKFNIDIRGNILNIEIVKSEGEKFDNEAIRLLKEGPDWLPATENGSPISKNVTLKVKFYPDNN